jgi:hypothetical protein
VTFCVSFFFATALSFFGAIVLFFLSEIDDLMAYLMDDGFCALIVEFLSYSGYFLKT